MAQSGAKSNIAIILVRPQLGENIGAAARIMLNFGFKDLRIVAPRDGWPNESALSMAAGAASVVENAQVYADLKSAISDCEIVYATTARTRYMHKPAINSAELASDIYGNNIAIIFGPERSGLDNDEVALADKILSIPVAEEYSSINLAQAVAVICYELAAKPLNKGVDNYELAKQQEVINFFELLEAKLDARGFFKVDDKKSGMVRNIRNIFKRITPLTKQDISTLHGIVKSLSG